MQLMRLVIKFVALVVTWVAGQNFLQRKTPTLRINAGELRGIVTRDEVHGTYYSYLGIPYATVTERFEAAKPVRRWQGVFDASNGNIKCPQRTMFNIIPSYQRTNVIGTEDCLTLNVYTQPNDKSDKQLKPVMIFIHGGGFRDGSASNSEYGPVYFLRHDIVLVTINYRLEVLGFLCLGIREAPGNVGLKDQTEALKWVKENIISFGGDPDNVTIFGESAGSASVTYHLLSPTSRGLFQKAIMQSGTAISPWSFQFEPLKIASKFAKQMGYNTTDPNELVKIFKSKTPEELLSTRVPRAKGDIVQSENIFVPCAEKEIPAVEPFITDTPYNIISKDLYAKVPMIIGYNNAEGYFFVGKENETTISNMNFYAALPRDLKFPTKEEAIDTAEKLKDLYLNNKEISKANLVPYEGESGIIYPTIATVDMLVKTNDKQIYTYKFSYSGFLNLVKIASGFANYPGASHADDLFYMFQPALFSIGWYLEKDMISKMTTMWTNFAKFGDPTPAETSLLPRRWYPTRKEEPHLLVIDKQFSNERVWNSDRFQFWNQTYSKYRRTIS